MLLYGEVIDTKTAFKTKQKDDENNTLFEGSILVRITSRHPFSSTNNVYAAPSSYNKRIPLIGEHVLIYPGVSNEYTDSTSYAANYFYLTITNSTNNVTLQTNPKITILTSYKAFNKNVPEILADKKEVGYTTKKNLKSYAKLQPYEGDDLWEGRYGQSIRFSRSFDRVNSPGLGIYEKNHSSYWKGKSDSDSLIILNVTKDKGSGYRVEDLSKDDASIYLTTSHKLLKLKGGFDRNKDVKQLASWDKGSSITLNSDRFVINAKKDKGFLIAKDELILTSKLIRFQTSKYNVSFDDLMDWIEEAYAELFKLASAQAFFTTAMGPTAVASNLAQITKISKAEWVKRFKKP